jgi:acetoacetate decarboxylase
MVGVRLDPSGPVTGCYSPYFFLDSDRLVAQGREVRARQTARGAQAGDARDLVVGTVTANDIDVLTGTLPTRRAGHDRALRSRVDMVTNINLRIVPGIDGTVQSRQLVARQLANVRVSECWTGPGTVESRPNAVMPLYRLPVLDFLDGYHWRADLELVAGRVVHDYLATDPPP